MNDTAYIYKVTNKITRMVYIGITRDRNVFSRWHEHIKSHSKLGKAIDLYGIENFVFEVLEKLYNISNPDLFRKESEYIERYKAIEMGYNSVYSAPSRSTNSGFSKKVRNGLEEFKSKTYLGLPTNNSNKKLSFWNLLHDQKLCILTLLSTRNYLTNKNSKYNNALIQAFNSREQRIFSIKLYSQDYYIDSIDEMIKLFSSIYSDQVLDDYEVIDYSVSRNYVEFSIENSEGKIAKFEVYGHMLYSDELMYCEEIKSIKELLD